MKEKRMTLITQGLIIFLFLIGSYMSIVLTVEEYSRAAYAQKQYSQTATGVIKSVKVSTFGRSTIYRYSTHFEDKQGKKYSTINIHDIGQDYQVGDSLTVHYNPKNPAESLAEDNYKPFKGFLLYLLMSFVVLAVSLALIFYWIVIYKNNSTRQ